MPLADVLVTGIIVIFTVVCLVTDVRSGRIPNWLTVPALGLGVITHTLIGGWSGLTTSLGGFAVGFGILFVMWLFRASGGGDVKMMGALGAWLGMSLTLEAFLASAVVDVIIVIASLFRGVVPERIRWFKPATQGKGPSPRRGRILPYAVPLSLGTWTVLAVAWWKAGGLF